MKLKCTETVQNNMFYTGQDYKVNHETSHQYTVIDALGHERVISKDTMRFIVRNDNRGAVMIKGIPEYAFFELV